MFYLFKELQNSYLQFLKNEIDFSIMSNLTVAEIFWGRHLKLTAERKALIFFFSKIIILSLLNWSQIKNNSMRLFYMHALLMIKIPFFLENKCGDDEFYDVEVVQCSFKNQPV